MVNGKRRRGARGANRNQPMPPEKAMMRDPTTARSRIHLGNLADTVTQKDLQARFQKYGPIRGIYLAPNGSFGFIQFANVESAEEAILSENFKIFHNRSISVKHVLQAGNDDTQNNQNQQNSNDSGPSFNNNASTSGPSFNNNSSASGSFNNNSNASGSNTHNANFTGNADGNMSNQKSVTPFSAPSTNHQNNPSSNNQSSQQGFNQNQNIPLNQQSNNNQGNNQQGSNQQGNMNNFNNSGMNNMNKNMNKAPPNRQKTMNMNMNKNQQKFGNNMNPNMHSGPNMPPGGGFNQMNNNQPVWNQQPMMNMQGNMGGNGPNNSMNPWMNRGVNMNGPRPMDNMFMGGPNNMNFHGNNFMNGMGPMHGNGSMMGPNMPPQMSGPNQNFPRMNFNNSVNEVEIVVASRLLTIYAEAVETRLKQLNFRTDILYPNEDVPVGKVLANIASRGVFFAILINPQNQEHRSITVNVLFGQTTEHRNMPLDDAIEFIAKSFYDKMRAEMGDAPPLRPLAKWIAQARETRLAQMSTPPSTRSDLYDAPPLSERHPEAVQILLNQLADNRMISVLQYDRAVKYLMQRRIYQSEVEGIADLKPAIEKEKEIEEQLKSVMNKQTLINTISLEHLNLDRINIDIDILPSTLKLLQDTKIQKALDSVLVRALV